MAIDILEIMYVDASGNEVSESQLKEKFGDNWEEKSKQAGYTRKEPDNTETNIDIEIETPEFNIDSLGGIVDENFWTPDSLPEGTSLVDPNKGFEAWVRELLKLRETTDEKIVIDYAQKSAVDLYNSGVPALLQHVLANDHQRHARRSEILLRPGVNNPERRRIKLPR